MERLNEACEKEEMFCADDCEWLSVTEKDQNRKTPKPPHFCRKYGMIVRHFCYHPKLVRLTSCKDYCEAIINAAQKVSEG